MAISMDVLPESGAHLNGSDPSAGGVSDVLDSISDGFHQIDAEGRFIRFNAAGREIYRRQGLDSDQLLGRSIFDVFSDMESSEQGRGLRLALGGKANSFEAEYAPWQRWFAIRNHPLPAGGVATFFLDITDRKQSQQSLDESQALYRALV